MIRLSTSLSERAAHVTDDVELRRAIALEMHALLIDVARALDEFPDVTDETKRALAGVAEQLRITR